MRTWRARSLTLARRLDTAEEPWRGWRRTQRVIALPLGGWDWAVGAVLAAWMLVAILRVTAP
jgi:hypothetical protein